MIAVKHSIEKPVFLNLSFYLQYFIQHFRNIDYQYSSTKKPNFSVTFLSIELIGVSGVSTILFHVITKLPNILFMQRQFSKYYLISQC